MFRLLFSTIIREPQSSAKVTYVRCTLEDSDRQGEDQL